MRRKFFFSMMAVALFLIGAVGSAYAKSSFVGYFATTYPGSTVGNFSCSSCHTSAPTLNSTYGQAIFNAGLSASSTQAQFSAAAHAIDNVDSDGDGSTNLAEITASPSTNPADPNSKPAPAPVACNGYTYSAWSACDASGQQTRTVIGNTPSGCTGTPTTQPVLIQACTPPSPTPTACAGYSYSAWSACDASGQQTRTVIGNTPSGCTGTPAAQPVLTQACNPSSPTPTACAGYSYSAWSACDAGGQQTRTVIGNTPLGCTGTPSTQPLLTQICNYVPPASTPTPTPLTMPVPSKQEVFTQKAITLPMVNGDPSKAQPMGFGPAAYGGSTLDLKVNLGPFDGPVNVSLVVFAPSIISNDLGFMSPDGLDVLSEKVNAEVQSAVARAEQESESDDDGTATQMPVMKFNELVLWKQNVTELNDTIYSGTVSDLPSGLYVFVLEAKSPGSEDSLYRWVSYIVIQ